MRVGLISKPEHCRPHVKAIKALGVKVEVLGGDPGVSIPRRVDAVVVRTCSISHAAFDVAKAWERDGGTAFYIEGATKAAEAIEEFMVQSIRERVEKLMVKVGWMHWHLLHTLDDAARTRLGLGHINAEVAFFQSVNPSTTRSATKVIASRAKGWKSVGFNVTKTAGRPTMVYFQEPCPRDKILRFLEEGAAAQGQGQPVEVPSPAREAAASAKLPPPPPPAPSPSAFLETLNSNTNAILDLMEQVEALKEKKPQALSPVVDALDVRIKALEKGVGQVKDPPANPFDVIEDFKRRLSEAGFQGTLTLTIE